MLIINKNKLKLKYFIIPFIIFSIYSKNTSAQTNVLEKKITLSASNEKLSDVLDKIGEQIGLNLTYNSEIVEINRITTLNAENVSVKDILKEIIRNDMVDYKVISSQLLIHRKRGTSSPQTTTPSKQTPHQTTPVKKSDKKTPEKVQTPVQKDTIISKQDITMLHDQELENDTIKQNDTLVSTKTWVNNDTIILFSEDKKDYEERIKKGHDIFYDSSKYRKFIIIRNDTFFMAKPIKPYGNYKTSKKTGIEKINLFNNLQFGLNKQPSSLNTNIFAQAYAGILFPVNHSVKATDNTYTQPAGTIQNTETSLPGFTSGVNMGIGINDWTVKTGIAYTQLRNKIRFNNKTTDIDTSINYDYTYDSYWDVFLLESYAKITGNDTTWVEIYDSTWITTVDTTEIAHYDTSVSGLQHNGINRYSYIEIPLIIGYTFKINDNISCSFNTGIIAGIYIHAKGKTLNPDDGKTLIALNRVPFAKTRFMYTGGINVHYTLTRQWKVLAGARYRQSLNSIYAKDYALSNKMNHVGMHTGVVYKF